MNVLNINDLQTDLAVSGLNLCKAFAAVDLADSVPDLQLSDSVSYVLLIGSAGTDLWAALPAHYLNRRDSIDEFSVDRINQSLGNVLAATGWQILFPDTLPDARTQSGPVPLQKLGALAGWHHPSPLGIGINATHGLWFAYRAVVAIDASVVVVDQSTGADKIDFALESPCLSCEATPCVSHCPATALSVGQNPDLDACVKHRLKADSVCASNCLARLACPVGSEFKYTSEQTGYFYRRSLAAAERWIKKYD